VQERGRVQGRGWRARSTAPSSDADRLARAAWPTTWSAARRGRVRRRPDCRNGVCELGHCVDLLLEHHRLSSRAGVHDHPRVAANGELFSGCLPAHGAITWTIRRPGRARRSCCRSHRAASAELVMSVDDPGQKVGVESVLDPCGCTRYTRAVSVSRRTAIRARAPTWSPPTSSTAMSPGPASPPRTRRRHDLRHADHLQPRGAPAVNHLRHLPDFGRFVLLMPSIPSPGELKPGAYQIQVSSFWPDDTHGLAIRTSPRWSRSRTWPRSRPWTCTSTSSTWPTHPCSAMRATSALKRDAAQLRLDAVQDPYCAGCTTCSARRDRDHGRELRGRRSPALDWLGPRRRRLAVLGSDLCGRHHVFFVRIAVGDRPGRGSRSAGPGS